METPQPQRAAGSHAPGTAYLALVAGIVCIGFAAIFVKLADAPGAVIAAWRLGIASIVLTPLAFANWRRGRARLPRSALWLAALSGLAFATDNVLWNTALSMTDAATATLLGNTSPLWVGLAAWLIFREKLGPAFWGGLVIAMAGVALIIGIDRLHGQAVNPGYLLALTAGVVYAVFQLATKRGRDRVDSLSYVWAFTLTGAVALLALTQALGNPLFGLPARSYLAVLGLGLISHVGGWLLITYAFGKLQTSRLTVTLLGQPIVTALVAMPILGEIPGIWQVVGGVVTLLGIYIVHRSGLNGQALWVLRRMRNQRAARHPEGSVPSTEGELHR